MNGPSALVLVQALLLACLLTGLVPGAAPRRLEGPPSPRAPRRGPVDSLLRGSLLRSIPELPTFRRSLRALVGWLGEHRLAAFVAGSVSLVTGPLALVGLAVVPFLAWLRDRRSARSHERRHVDELPDVVDLLRLAVASGCTVHLAVEAVVRHGTGSVAAELSTALERVARGARLADSLSSLRSEVAVLAPVLDALVAAERYGTPLGPVLERLADDARGVRRRRAEAAARQVPVKLLFPLVLCILPSIGFLTVVPVASSALGGMDLGL